MEKADRLAGYLSILEIRKKAFHRNLFIAGGLFLLAILATSATLLLTDWNVRTIWLLGIFDVVFTISYIMTWVRYETTRRTMELVKNLQAGE